jgi:hypothetical protein
MASQVEVIRANREADAQRQIAATNFGAPEVEQVAPGIPVSNDAALAASLKQIRDNSQEYARLNTEASRQQWEAIAADNFRRTQSAASEASDKMAVEAMNNAVRRQIDGDKAILEWGAVVKGVDPNNDTEWTLPLNKLKDIAVTQQKVINTTGIDPLNFNPMDAPVQTKQKNGREYLAPVPFPDGKLYHVENLADGQVKLNLSTGETFTGDMETLLGKVAESKVQTTAWARQKAQQAQAQIQQPAAPPAENLGQDLTASGSLADDLAARQADALAKQFGFSDKTEMQQWGESVNQKMAMIQEFEQDKAISRFFTQHPDFPGSDQANDALGQIIDERGWEVNADNLEMAHLIAVQRNLYQPLSADAIQAFYANAPQQVHRVTAPPMLRTNNPEVTNQSPDPYAMPLADLRRQAIAQELNGKGPGYR